MAFLSGLPWRLIGSLAAVLAVTALVHSCQHYQKKAARLEGQLDAAIDVSNANAENAKHYAEEAERLSNVTAKVVEVKNEIRQRSQRRQDEIAAVPASEDGPLAPVLRDQLNRLPVAVYPDKSGDPRTAANSGFLARADAGAIPAGAERDAKRRGARD